MGNEFSNCFQNNNKSALSRTNLNESSQAALGKYRTIDVNASDTDIVRGKVGTADFDSPIKQMHFVGS